MEASHLKMIASFDDPAAGSCGYRLEVTTDAPPEAGPWSRENIREVFSPYIKLILSQMENITITVACNEMVVFD